MEKFTFPDLLDIDQLQTMMELFYQATKIPVSITDTHGTVNIATGQQDICTRFFHKNPATAQNCHKSFEDLQSRLVEGQPYEHLCPYGLCEIAVPITVEGLHIATLSLQQFYYPDRKPDDAAWEAQAKQHGFDAESFREAASRVPVVSRDLINRIIAYYVSFVQFISQQGHTNLALKREILAREKTETILREERDLLNGILETNLAGIVKTDNTGQIIFANAFAEEVLGLSKQEITQRAYNAPDWHITDYDGKPFPDEKLPFSLVKTTHKPVYDIRHAIQWADGRRTLLSINASPSANAAGEFDGMTASINDVTERIHIEQNLKEEKELAQQYLDIASVAFLVLDHKGCVTRINKKGLAILGYSESELVGKNWFKTCVPERLRAPVFEVFKTLIAGQIEPVEYYENLVLTKNGEERMVAWHNSLLHNAQNEITGILSSGFDITEELEARQTLEESERRFRSLYTMMSEGFALHDLVYGDNGEAVDYRILNVNPAYEQLIGIPYKTAVGARASELYGTGSPPYLDIYKDVGMTGNPAFFETYFPPLDKHFAISVFSPGPHQFATVFFDVTDRVKASEALQESESKYRSVYETAPLAFVVWDLETNVIDWNKRAEELFGWTREEVLGKSFFDFIVSEHERPHVKSIVTTLLNGEMQGQVVNENVTKKGDNIICQWSNTALHGSSGKIIGVISLAFDITERLRVEQELAQHREHLEELVTQRTDELQATLDILAARSRELADKNKELETFTYSVSHDLKAPLRGIDGYSRLLLEDYAHLLDDDGRMFLYTIRQATRQMHQLIEDLLAYSRIERHKFTRESVNLPSIVNSALTEFNGELKARDIQVTQEFLVEEIYADPHGLSQALRNLIDNAIKFTRDSSEPRIDIHAHTTQNECVIWVKDNGIGFDPKYRDRIFRIFERLNRSEEYPGTGVGLAIVQKAMSGMGGSVRAESEPEQGATFYLEIPQHKDNKL